MKLIAAWGCIVVGNDSGAYGRDQQIRSPTG
jgi:hypothetical protein